LIPHNATHAAGSKANDQHGLKVHGSDDISNISIAGSSMNLTYADD
jgi:hypothetical protein